MSCVIDVKNCLHKQTPSWSNKIFSSGRHSKVLCICELPREECDLSNAVLFFLSGSLAQIEACLYVQSPSHRRQVFVQACVTFLFFSIRCFQLFILCVFWRKIIAILWGNDDWLFVALKSYVCYVWKHFLVACIYACLCILVYIHRKIYQTKYRRMSELRMEWMVCWE